jgi:hypothetical protein
MEKKPPKIGMTLLPIGTMLVVVGTTISKENPTLKYLVLGASIVVLFASIYLNIKSAKQNKDANK